MKHLDEATLTTLRDRETQDSVVLDHLATCDRCAAALLEIERREAFIARALAAIDEEDGIPLAAAKARVRARLDERSARDSRTRAWWWPRHMGRAAAVLLVAAGAVSALPGSPVRQWLIPSAQEAGHSAVATAPTQEILPAGIEVAVPPSGLRVEISPVGPLVDFEVAWNEGLVATVEAPPGSRFSYAEGRLEAIVAGGPVRVVLPRTGPRVAVQVDGRPYIVRSDAGTEITGPVGEHSDERIRFLGPS